MSASQIASSDHQRPDFMMILGLLPPYSLEDVQRAYHEKSRTAHPDRGGSVSQFVKLKEAYDRATEYARFRESRTKWLSAQVARYALQAQVVDEIRRRGGRVVIEEIDWLKRSFGDFAVVMEKLVEIRLRSLADGNAFLQYLASQKSAVEYVRYLDIADSQISDEGLLHLRTLVNLRQLDLAGTPITERALGFVESLHGLEWLNLARTSINWWTCWKLQRSLPRLRVVRKG